MTKQNMSCLFCTDEELCTIHAKKESKKKLPRPRATPEPTSVAVSPDPEPIRSSGPDPFDAPKRSRLGERAASHKEEQLSDDELTMREAVRNLWPILGARERNRNMDFAFPPKGSAMSKKAFEVRRSLDGRQN